MGKQGIERKSKLIIARDKFCDADFDRLVIDTSHSVARKSLNNGSSGSTSPAADAVAAIAAGRSPNQHDQMGATSCDLTSTQTSNSSVHVAADRSNQPKRPMNAFMVWGQAIRRELHHKFSNVQNALLSKALGRVWRSLDPADKEPFVRRANMIKANHKRDYPNYRYQPRRVQERRAKNNMLIGINLNHPVNQHQCQQATYSSSSSSLLDNQTATIDHHHLHHHNQFAYQSSSEYHNQLSGSEESNRKLFISSTNWRRNLSSLEPRARDLSKDTIDGVQTFEYHPYPSVAAAATAAAAGGNTAEITTIECNNCSRPTTANNGCQNEVNCREGQQQTSIYPPYQQITTTYTTNNTQQHHHHHQQQHYNSNHLPQQQQQPFSYEITQSNHHVDGCHSGSLKAANGTAGLYYDSR